MDVPYRLNVLYAEDNPDDVALFRYALRQSKATLRTVPNGDEAIRYFKGEGEYADRSRYPHPDILFVDWRMPVVSGRELLKWCKTSPEIQSLPVVVFAGSGLKLELDEARAMGADLVMSKQNRFAVLANCLDEILSILAKRPVAATASNAAALLSN
ncbi:MAG: response regulator [Verrucomicrobiia bacterium]